MATNRLKRCKKLASQGKLKKANNSLDDTQIAYLDINNNKIKLNKKFPNKNKNNNKWKFHKINKNTFKLDYDKTRKTLLNSNREASKGVFGIDNKYIHWMVINDNKTDFVRTL